MQTANELLYGILQVVGKINNGDIIDENTIVLLFIQVNELKSALK